jgi:hypothetical protein
MAKARSHFPEGVSAVTPMLVLPSCVRAIGTRTTRLLAAFRFGDARLDQLADKACR